VAALNNPARVRRVELQRMRRHNLATFVAIAALLTPLAIGSAWVLSNVQRSAASDPDVVVEVLPGWTAVEIGDALQQAGVITSSAEFQSIATSSGFTGFKAGRYLFVAGSEEREALDTLRGGPALIVPDYKLLLPPGLTMAGIAERVGKLPGKSADVFLQVAQSGTVRSRYEPEGVMALEGLTWPDTYFIGANETETQILQKIVDEFDNRADELGLAGADATGLPPYQTLIAASLIQTESGSDADSPIISAVIRNRLTQGMLLQIDATLCYAKGGCPPVPVDADRKIDSPYNTYKAPGLPPTPIATVSAASLTAALNPTADTYLFYVSDKNGVTYFATTQGEHERNVQKARNVD
jgi:UPF0755 protein